MPLDPDIPFRALAGMQRAQPYDPLEVQGQIDRNRVYQAQAQKAQQEMQSQQRLQQLAQQYGDDPDELVKQLGSVDPMLAQKLGEQIGQARYAGAQAHLEQTKSAEAEIDSWQRLLQSTDDKTWGAVRTAAVQKMPQLASVLPAEYSDDAKQQALALGMSAKDWAKTQSEASQLYLDGKTQDSAARILAGADNPQKRQIAEGLLKQAGLSQFSQMWATPQEAQAFLTSQQKAEPEKAGSDYHQFLTTFAKERNKTPDQLSVAENVQAKKLYGQADDRPRVSVSVTGPASAPKTIDDLARGSGYTVAGLRKAAEAYHESGALPALGNRAAAKQAIQNAEALLYPTGDIAMTGAGFKANQGALNAITKQYTAVKAYEQTGLNNLKMFTDLAAKIPDTGVPWLNTPVRYLSANMVGSANMAAVNAARQVALTEISKVVNNPNLSGALSDSARSEVLGLIPENATFGQIKRVADVLRRDMANRPAAMQKQISDLKYEMAHPGASAPQAEAPAGSSDIIGANDVKAPNGKIYHFATKAQADAFKRSAGIQ